MVGDNSQRRTRMAPDLTMTDSNTEGHRRPGPTQPDVVNGADSALPDVTVPDVDPDEGPGDSTVDLAPDLEATVDVPAPPTCEDETVNGGETDTDCGGETSCPRCGDGKTCGGDDDCASGRCVLGSCAEPACSDDVSNGSETDVDCGGSCTACANGKYCKSDGPCPRVRPDGDGDPGEAVPGQTARRAGRHGRQRSGRLRDQRQRRRRTGGIPRAPISSVSSSVARATTDLELASYAT